MGCEFFGKEIIKPEESFFIGRIANDNTTKGLWR